MEPSIAIAGSHDIHIVWEDDSPGNDEIFIIGRGMYDKLKVTLETHALLQSNNIELIEIDSHKACDEYNALAPARRVAAGIHLTC